MPLALHISDHDRLVYDRHVHSHDPVLHKAPAGESESKSEFDSPRAFTSAAHKPDPLKLSFAALSLLDHARQYARHGASDSVDTAATSASTEDIELYSFAIDTSTGRGCVVGEARAPGVSMSMNLGHGRFASSASGTSTSTATSASTLSSSSAVSRSSSPSPRRQSLSLGLPSTLDPSVGECECERDSVRGDDDAFMSPRLARYEHRIHLTTTANAHPVDPEAQLRAASLPPDPDSKSLYSPTPDGACSPPLETDSLLRCSAPLGALPLPVTSGVSAASASGGTRASPLPMSFTLVETGVHALGAALVSLLCALSIWLTLANVNI